MRLFVALPVTEAVRAQLLDALDPWRSGQHPDADSGWRWTRPEGWHVTLAFLGEVADERADEVAHVAGDAVVGTGEVELTVGEVDHFRRRVLHLTLADAPPGQVAHLGSLVQRALVAADLPVDERGVTPHLTVARARRRARPALGAPAVPAVSWTVTAAAVYVSRLHPEGAHYEVRDRLPLT